MKWTQKVWEHGEIRQRTAFLFIPKRTFKDGYFIWKWLTRATWNEKHEASWGDSYWYPTEWID